MSLKPNGRRRDPRRVLISLFILLVSLICFFLTFKDGFRWAWFMISCAVLYFAFAMFKNSNEL